MLPHDIAAEFGKNAGYATFFLSGFGFGWVLEIAGFGDARKLASQFYLKDMTVLKVMFTGILVACLLLFSSSALGLLDFSKIFVNQTYLWPGVVGGLIMGVGFISGGYCPGTSVVSAASLKLDGMMFVLGTLLGVGIFGETVEYFSNFWVSSYSERYLISDVLGWSIGATVVAVTLLALIMFYGAEKSEAYFGAPTHLRKFSWALKDQRLIGASTIFILIALGIWGLGQPSPERRWELFKDQYTELLQSREVFIHPLEYVKTWNDSAIKLVTLDLRSKSDFDIFHLQDSQNITPETIRDPKFASDLAKLPAQGVVILIAKTEQDAIWAWQILKVQGVTNLYILEQGIENWKATFSEYIHAQPNQKTKGLDEILGHIEHFDLSRPSMKIFERFPKDAFTPKIKIKIGKKSGGLCG